MYITVISHFHQPWTTEGLQATLSKRCRIWLRFLGKFRKYSDLINFSLQRRPWIPYRPRNASVKVQRQPCYHRGASTTARPSGPSAAEPWTVETFRDQLLLYALLGLEYFNTSARTKPAEVAAALESLALGYQEAKQGMTVSDSLFSFLFLLLILHLLFLACFYVLILWTFLDFWAASWTLSNRHHIIIFVKLNVCKMVLTS